MIERAEVEAMLAVCVPGSGDAFLAELCRTWLAVDAAPEGVVEEEMSGLVIYASPLPKGQRVRLVRVGEE